MCQNRGKRIGVALVLILALAGPAWAQERERPGGPRSAPPVMEELGRTTEQERGGADDREERARHFQAKKRERLLQALQLDDATRSRLNQRLEQLEQKAGDLRRQRREAMQVLREHVKDLRKETRLGRRHEADPGADVAPPPPAGGAQANTGDLQQALAKVYAADDAMAELRRERVQAARELLTPEQQAKYLLVTMKFRKDMRERMRREQSGQEGGSRDKKRRFEGGGDGDRR